MPLEITRDIAQERGLNVDEKGFIAAMDAHRLASGAGKAMGALGGDDVDVYRHLRDELKAAGKLPPEGVSYNPYGDPSNLAFESDLLALIVDSNPVDSAAPGDRVEVLLPETDFYIESGGQVSDTGMLSGQGWQIKVTEMRRPAAGIIVHVGEVLRGNPKVGDKVRAAVDAQRRKDIMRNHTATHLLHAALHHILGPHARQAGSLVAPDRLRFDFTHPEALTYPQIEAIEQYVNDKILDNYELETTQKSLKEALDGGATALFGEKYGEIVRNIQMGDPSPTLRQAQGAGSGEGIFSNELCGGTHVDETNDIGIFMITSEGSAAAGIRRIEAITGREAFHQLQERRRLLNQVAQKMGTSPEKVVERAEALNEAINDLQKQIAALRQNMAALQFTNVLDETAKISEVNVLTAHVREADSDTLRQLADQFRTRYPKMGVIVLGTVQNEKPMMIAAVTEDLIGRGIKAGDLVKFVAQQVGGGGGGKPTLAQAGGRDASKLDEALASVPDWVKENLK
ncbi:MAG TPA: hypothetical protein DEH22_17250 [Chloroflexi bacterium]|nr:hypothetical protein [Chloroflexota bacterium]